MKASKIFLGIGAASLVLVTGAPSRGLGATPEGRSSAIAATAATPAQADNIVIVQADQGVDAALATHAFVVLRRTDGSVPRAYLWDEPLGCPKSRPE